MCVQTRELIRARDSSSSGVITLSDKDFFRYATANNRSYSMIIFFNAKVKESAHLKMAELLANFKVEAAHVRKAAKDPQHATVANKVFFVEMEFSKSQKAFAMLRVQTIPYILHFSPKLSSGCVASTLLIPNLRRCPVLRTLSFADRVSRLSGWFFV
jgi:hypothetical protein